MLLLAIALQDVLHISPLFPLLSTQKAFVWSKNSCAQAAQEFPVALSIAHPLFFVEGIWLKAFILTLESQKPA